MSITIVLEQMIIIMILILTGVFLFRKKMISEDTSRQISGLIVNITNPAILICSAFDDTPKLSLRELGVGMCVFLLSYAILILSAYLIPLILRIPESQRYSYRMLTIFGNVGFIGIPLASAVLGSGCLIFVSMSNLIYNILVYTFGLSTLKNAASKQRSKNCNYNKQQPAGTNAVSQSPENRISSTDSDGSESILSRLINAGTVSALLTVIFYLGNFKVPSIISSTLTYAGRTTTFLSMLVLGVSVAQMALKDIFSQPKLYVFTLLRQIMLPIGFTLILSRFITAPLILNTCALLLAVPAGNMPLMLSKQLGVDESTISRGIILTTILSLVTIPIVTLFIQ